MSLPVPTSSARAGHSQVLSVFPEDETVLSFCTNGTPDLTRREVSAPQWPDPGVRGALPGAHFEERVKDAAPRRTRDSTILDLFNLRFPKAR